MNQYQQQQEAATLAKAVLRAGKAMGITQEELGSIIGRDRTGIARGLDPNSKSGELALLVVRLYRALHSLCGDDTTLIHHWLNTANRDTGGVPRQQVQQIQGLVRLVDYLEAAHGQ